MKRPAPSPNRKRAAGSALIAILWIVSILSIAVFSATQFLFIELESESNATALFHAELMADRGVAIASHPNVERGDRALSGSFRNGDSFSARISSEGDRLNLNTLLENPEDDRIVLEELFFQWGLRIDEAVRVVDNLIDWVDEDDEITRAGAERRDYLAMGRPNHPFNRPFHSLSEVLLVRDFDLVVAANPAWRESFTLLSEGPLDLNEAPADLISAACQCTFEAARRFVATRNGLDGIPGTIDDLRIDDLETALTMLGVPAGFFELIEPRVTLEDSTKRILSVGRSGSISVERAVTIQYTGERGRIAAWSTRRIE
jgi:general secretion pathway protein K